VNMYTKSIRDLLFDLDSYVHEFGKFKDLVNRKHFLPNYMVMFHNNVRTFH